MPNTYKAVLKGNHLEWLEGPPANLDSGQPIAINVSILEEPSSLTQSATQGEKMADALEKLAALNALPDISDPEAWQREARQDRTLPGRDT
jgi:hypothetical protein